MAQEDRLWGKSQRSESPWCWNFCLLEKGKEKGGTRSKRCLVFYGLTPNNLLVATFISSHSYNSWKKSTCATFRHVVCVLSLRSGHRKGTADECESGDSDFDGENRCCVVSSMSELRVLWAWRVARGHVMLWSWNVSSERMEARVVASEGNVTWCWENVSYRFDRWKLWSYQLVE